MVLLQYNTGTGTGFWSDLNNIFWQFKLYRDSLTKIEWRFIKWDVALDLNNGPRNGLDLHQGTTIIQNSAFAI